MGQGMESSEKMHYLIHSLPRTGSTTLARVLNCHPDLSCLIEPFHPKRHDGFFNRIASNDGSIDAAVAMLALRWSGLKHVFESGSGWPFTGKPNMNDRLLLLADKVILLKRRDYLKRYLSGYIAKHLRFWIGSREEFLTRLQGAAFPPIEPVAARDEIAQDQLAMKTRDRIVAELGIISLTIYYEDLFDNEGQINARLIEQITDFLEVRRFLEEEHREQILAASEPLLYRWASSSVYDVIPNVKELEALVSESSTNTV